MDIIEKFNPLNHPVCFAYPLRVASTTWMEHIPFGMFLVDILRPSVIVELGSFNGSSYCAFCQAVKQLNLDTRCYAVDTWKGDPHSGFYDGAKVLDDLRSHHEPLYGDFSRLIQSTFDEAVIHFPDQSIDLLHIDGYHTYEAVKHDFETWLPKVSGKGVVLFHDTNVREKDFGVWRLWEELKLEYPHFEFMHGRGLGILATGESYPDALRRTVIEISERDKHQLRGFFYGLGQRLESHLERDFAVSALAERDEAIEFLSGEVKQQDAHIHEQERQLQQQDAHIHEQERQLQQQDAHIHEQERQLQQQERQLQQQENTIRYLETTLNQIYRTRAWRVARKYWGFKERVVSTARNTYRAVVPYNIRIGFRYFRHPEERPDSPPKIVRHNSDPAEDTAVKPVSLKPQYGTYDVICLANIEWGARYQRPQQSMSQFAAHGHRVFYVVASRFVKTGEQKKIEVTGVANNIFEVYLQNNQPLNFYQEAMNESTEALFLASLEQLRQKYRIKTAVCIVHLPFWTPLALCMRQRWGWPVLYDCMDEWTDFPNIGQPLLDQEEKLVQDSDIVTVTADLLEKKWAAKSKNCLLVRNGVDFNFFTQNCRPNQLLQNIPHPIIGYYGALAEWVDFELVAFLAKERPNWQFVLIGDVFVDNMAGLDKLPNVHFLGRHPYLEMPLFLYHFNVCLIPFKLNDVTHAVDPVKFYEFISAGKPIVAVPLSELLIYQEYLYLAATPVEFLAKVQVALAENDPDMMRRRITLAKNNDWLDRYRKMDRAIIETYGKASIIVVTFNNVELTQLCVESVLRNTTYPNYELILVDNHSEDATTNYLLYLAQKHERIKIILNNENKGFAAANNQGLKLATGDYLVLLNNDTVMPRGWLTSLVKHLQDPHVGLVGPVTNFAGNEAKIDVPYKTLDRMESFAQEYTHQHEGQVFDINVLAMYCVAMRRNTFEKIGLLDEGFGIGMFEDDDYSNRMRAAGYRVICAEDVFVHHFGQAAFKKLLASGEYQKIWDANQVRFESKWGKWTAHRARKDISEAWPQTADLNSSRTHTD